MPVVFHELRLIAPTLWTGLQTILSRFTALPDVSALNQAAKTADITNACGLPIQFVTQTAPCGQRDYEAQIYRSGLVPTRPGHWHDIFNALMWLTYPKIKGALNAVHARQPHATASSQRTSASDAATLFDESGAILIGPDPRLAQWLIDHDWKTAFVTHRHLWQSHHLLVTGHAVLEKLADPYPGMITKVIYQPWPAINQTNIMAPPPELDDTIAQRWLANEFSRPSQLFPIPILGIPGADTGNENPAYYDNTSVFRIKRKHPAHRS